MTLEEAVVLMPTEPSPRPSGIPLDPVAWASIETPALVVDLGRMEAAIEQMAATMRQRGVALRPHAKTHKSLEVGRRQLAAGAVGLTVGTSGEAEVFAGQGVHDLTIAYPVLARGAKADRLRRLVAGGARLTVGIDSAQGVRLLGEALGADSSRLHVLVEIDSGGRRTGVAPEAAGVLAALASEHGLTVDGVFTHGGHGYAGPSARSAAADDEVSVLSAAVASFQRVGLEARVVSAGSTPTAAASARGVVTEERPGTYVFGDRQQVALGSIGPDAVAAVVLATVVSVDAGSRRFVIDAGAKILGKDIAPYIVGHGELPGISGAAVARVYDYHGVVEPTSSGGSLPMVGDVVQVVPNHICPVVNLVDGFHVATDGTLTGRWPVDARGRNG